MKYLLDVTGAANPEPVVQTDLELVEEQVWYPTAPTKVSGVATAVVGPPTAGTYALDEKWVDAKGALFVCVTAGTPGTWVQLRPAVVSADPATGTIPTGYLIARSDLRYLVKYHAGSYVWREVVGHRTITMLDGANFALGTSTGTKIGTGSGEKLAFWGATPVTRPTGVSQATGGSTVDAEARAAVNALITRLETLGFLEPI